MAPLLLKLRDMLGGALQLQHYVLRIALQTLLQVHLIVCNANTSENVGVWLRCHPTVRSVGTALVRNQTTDFLPQSCDGLVILTVRRASCLLDSCALLCEKRLNFSRRLPDADFGARLYICPSCCNTIVAFCAASPCRRKNSFLLFHLDGSAMWSGRAAS